MALKRTLLLFVIVSCILAMGAWILPKNTILASAAQEGNLGTVNLMLSFGAKPNASSGNLTALNFAVRQGHIDVVKRLLQAGANPNLKGSIGDVTSRAYFTPLEDAINYHPQDMEMLELLLQAGANPNDYFTLDHAVESENIEALKLLLNAGADKAQVIQLAEFYKKPQIVALSNELEISNAPLNQKQVVNQSPKTQNGLKHSEQLIEASEKGDLNTVKQLISKGFDLNSQNKDTGVTPLMQASLFGHVDVVGYLLNHGADPNKKDAYGNNALDNAIYNESSLNKDVLAITKIVASLISAGVNVSHVVEGEHSASTPLIEATNNGYSDIVKMLIKAGADPNLSGNDGKTPLMYAALRGHEDIINALISSGADPNKLSSEGKTALVFAIEGGHQTVVPLLEIDNKSNLNKNNPVATNVIKAEFIVRNSGDSKEVLPANQNEYKAKVGQTIQFEPFDSDAKIAFDVGHIFIYTDAWSMGEPFYDAEVWRIKEGNSYTFDKPGEVHFRLQYYDIFIKEQVHTFTVHVSQ